jgi:hypothetical protein
MVADKPPGFGISPSPPRPDARLWAATGPPSSITQAISPPAYRLISLSHRADGSWAGLIDLGGGVIQRAQQGDMVGEWRVEIVDGSHLLIANGETRHRMELGP